MIKKSLQNQSISFKDTLMDVQPRTITVTFVHAGLLVIGITLGMFIITGIRVCHKPPVPLRDCSSCHNKFTSYFQKRGSKTPEEMAFAVLQTKSPKLFAAVAVVESRGNPHVRNTGYKKRHSGAFQVADKYHGKVSRNAIEQALQAESILKELVEEKGSIVKGLNAYGGDKTRGVYAKNILDELKAVPK